MENNEEKETFHDENGEVFDVENSEEFNNGKGEDENEYEPISTIYKVVTKLQ